MPTPRPSLASTRRRHTDRHQPALAHRPLPLTVCLVPEVQLKLRFLCQLLEEPAQQAGQRARHRAAACAAQPAVTTPLLGWRRSHARTLRAPFLTTGNRWKGRGEQQAPPAPATEHSIGLPITELEMAPLGPTSGACHIHACTTPALLQALLPTQQPRDRRAQPAAHALCLACMMAKSAATEACRPGYCTLTATWLPSVRSTPWCTCRGQTQA